MASLVYVVETPGHLYGRGFSVVRGVTPTQARTVPLKQIFLAIVTLKPDEKMPRQFVQMGNWRSNIRLGGLEAAVWDGSRVETYPPIQSESVDKSGRPRSDMLYFGRNNEKGVLLQYLDPSINVTGDVVSHASVHHHKISVEHYDLLWGFYEVWLRNIFTDRRKTVRLGGPFSDGHLAVQLNWQHPSVAARKPSAVLISTDPPNNKKDDHNYDERPFGQVFPKVIAAYTQKMHDPFAMG